MPGGADYISSAVGTGSFGQVGRYRLRTTARRVSVWHSCCPWENSNAGHSRGNAECHAEHRPAQPRCRAESVPRCNLSDELLGQGDRLKAFPASERQPVAERMHSAHRHFRRGQTLATFNFPSTSSRDTASASVI